MARIAGIDLPNSKRVEIGLTYIYGIGPTSSRKILAQTGVDADTRCRDLAEMEVVRLREVIDRQYMVEGELRREVAMSIRLSIVVQYGIISCHPVPVPWP